MRRRLYVICNVALIVGVLGTGTSAAQETPEPGLVLREASDIRRTVVAAEVFAVDGRLEARIAARLPGVQKGRLQNVLFVGRGMGRRPPKTRSELFEPFEEEAPYPTRRSGAIDFSGKKVRQAEGTVIREMMAFDLPDPVLQDGRYELWVDVEELQSGGKPWRFKFDLDRLYDVVQAQTASE